MRIDWIHLHDPGFSPHLKTLNHILLPNPFRGIIFTGSENWVVDVFRTFQVALVVKNPPANAGRHKRQGFDPWVGKISRRRKLHLTPIFLPEKFHG